MRLELHCHSTCSDGSQSPEALAEAAGDYGVELFCLTDHDNMAGCERAAAALPGVRSLRSLELSCKHAGRTVHLLIWGVGEGEGRARFEARLADLHRQRSARIVAICERLAELGVELDAQAILEASAGSTPGRPDVAKALVAAGVCSSMREAFDRFLKDDGPANVAIEGMSLEEGLAHGRACGARMALAHPHTLRKHALVEALFSELREQGLEGIEAFYGSVSPARAEPWLRLARKHDLVVTAGSDFHGESKVGPARQVGIELPEPHAGRLREWLSDAPAIR